MRSLAARAAAFSFAERQRVSFERVLRDFVEVASVSADPDRRGDVERMAELAVETIRRMDGAVRVYRPRGGRPVVHGLFDQGRGLPTVTVYNHLDVQPASRETEPWHTEPFRLVKKGSRYFGRGTTDDKGPAVAALFGICAARERGVAANLRLLWELEEEIGSPHLAEALAGSGTRMRTDCVLVSDTMWVSPRRPTCPSALRGFQGFSFVLQTGREERHSGDVGGAARNPLGELMALICQIYDPVTGRVKIPGFYDDVVPPTRREIRAFRSSGFSVPAFQRDNHLLSLRVQDPLAVMARIWAEPTFEIHGVAGGYAGPGLKSIVPARAEIKASCRLVPDQRPEAIARLVRSFVRDRNPDVNVRLEGASQPYRGVTTGPLADAVRKAMRTAFGREPAFIREGGSIGAVTILERAFRCPILFLPLSLPGDGYHAPNESFGWRQAAGGIVAFAAYFEEVSRLRRPAGVPLRPPRSAQGGSGDPSGSTSRPGKRPNPSTMFTSVLDRWRPSCQPWEQAGSRGKPAGRTSMRRRELVTTLTGAGALLAGLHALGGDEPPSAPSGAGAGPLKPPEKGKISVAFLISDGATVIDFAGPWEVFQDVHVMSRGPTMDEMMPFALYTVAETQEVVTASAGMKIVPNHTFETAPPPKVVVVGAQRGRSPALLEWLRRVSQTADVTMSVCTGAFLLAGAGLLSGREATTHHDYYDAFEKQFPGVRLRRGLRFVEGPGISTAGGLTSGVDLALRVVERYFGREVARATADYLEYQGAGWILS